MATNNAVNTTLTNQTGVGSFVGSTSPSLISPTLGAATATSVVFSPSTKGIIGITDGSDAPSGIVGEYLSAQVLTSAPVSVSQNVVTSIASISLTPGDWDVGGNVGVASAGLAVIWISDDNINIPSDPINLNYLPPSNAAALGGVCAQNMRFSLNSTTTIYLIALRPGAGSVNMYGGIWARRVR